MADRETVLALKLLAAQAEKLASDAESGRLWSRGDLQRRISDIRETLNSIPEDRGR